MSDTWIDIGGIDEIPQKGSRVVKTTSGDVAVFRTVNDEVFALRDRCPHKGGSLSEGVSADGIVTCPLHHWRFDLRSGQCPERPKVILRTYPVRREGDQIFVGI